MSAKKPSLKTQFTDFMKSGEDWETLSTDIEGLAIQKQPEYELNGKTYPAKLKLILLRENGSSFKATEITPRKVEVLKNAFNHAKFDKMLTELTKFQESLGITQNNSNSTTKRLVMG